MSTSPHEINGRDFAHQCINALANVKQSLPQNWQIRLEPFKNEIKDYSSQNNISNSAALHKLLNFASKEKIDLNIIRIKHLFLMAAYCDML